MLILKFILFYDCALPIIVSNVECDDKSSHHVYLGDNVNVSAEFFYKVETALWGGFSV